jgi:hypothetical protein
MFSAPFIAENRPHLSRRASPSTFVSFDKKAVKVLTDRGFAALILR